jgi:deoxyribose-phosphate aldolase
MYGWLVCKNKFGAIFGQRGVRQHENPFVFSRSLPNLRTTMTLADQVRAAGVVGAGGGGFPTHLKISAKADTVIANGAECEPLLHKDAVVMESYAAELVNGMELTMDAVGASQGVIGIKAKNQHALDTVEEACALSKAAGADYVKTSTGFGPGGATVADVELMRRVVGPDIGVKAAGGVRDYEALKSLVSAGASRVGASAGVKIVQQSKGGAQPPASTASAVPAKSLY